MHQDSHQSQDSSLGSLPPQGVVFPNQSVQNHIHELAKTLPPPRKQNTACDACRTRKVRCHRIEGQEKCQHCLLKNYPCTHYVQQATSERRRSATTSRRPKNISATGAKYPLKQIDRGSPTGELKRSTPPSSSSVSSPGQNRLTPPESSISNTSPSPAPPVFKHSSPSYQASGFYTPITLHTPTPQLLAYLFSPPENAREQSPLHSDGKLSPYADWGDMAYKLEDPNFRFEFAQDLVEVFFEIVHTRLPLLNPAMFRTRLAIQSSLQVTSTTPESQKTLHPALVATVLAWGTKFSEHPLLVADRRRPSRQSHLAKTLLDKTRDIAEALKVHRVPTADHVVISLLIEPLQNQNIDEGSGVYSSYPWVLHIENIDEGSGFHGFWLTSAVRHLLALQINHKAVTSTIPDPEARGTMIFAWWMTCIADAYRSVYYRRKPMLDDDDYDIDFYTADPIAQDGGDPQTLKPSPREQLEFLGYYRAAHALARIARHMSKQLWKPVIEAEGIPVEVLYSLKRQLIDWRDQYLPHVGVPSNFKAQWDFVSAVSACASDATYYLMWIILFNAMDDFGIRDASTLVGDGQARVYDVQKKVMDEALHGALRIAGLAGVLTSNGYLRLDPAVMHVSCIQAGTFLARLGRPEVSNCIAGLDQYSFSYEEAGEQAAEIKRIYNTAKAGELDFNHMTPVLPRVGVLEPQPPAMDVDQGAIGGGGLAAHSSF